MKTFDIRELSYNGKTVFVFSHELMIAMMCAKYTNGSYITGDLSNQYAEINNDTVNDITCGFAKQALCILPLDEYYKAACTVCIGRYFIQEDKLSAISKATKEYMIKDNDFMIGIGMQPKYSKFPELL